MTLSVEEKLNVSGRAAAEKKASDSTLLDLREMSTITDYFLICSGGSDRQVQTIADAIDEELSKRDVHPVGREGYDEGRWILLDYDDFIVHVFQPEVRKFYDLERLWGAAPQSWADEEGAFSPESRRHQASV